MAALLADARYFIAAIVAVTILLFGFMSGSAIGAAASAAAPVLSVTPMSGAIGQTVQVTGKGLPPGSIYQVQVCGQNAVHGSSDCAGAGAVSTQTDPEGTLSAPVQVVLPPTQCPCVVGAFSVTTASALTTPISIEGASTSPAPVSPPRVPVSHLVVVHAGFTGSTPAAQWFGFQATRTVALTVLNRGSAPASLLHLFASLGSTPVVSRRLTELGAGQVRTYDVPVTFPALTVGNETLIGHIVTRDGQLVGFKASVAVWPFGLLVAGLIIAQMILLAWRNVARRRYERKNLPSLEPEDPSTTETEAVSPLSYTV